MGAAAVALGQGDEQGEPFCDGGVPCTHLGRRGQQGRDHRDGKVAAKALSRGEILTMGECRACPLAGESSSGNIAVAAEGLPRAGPSV